MSLQSGPRTFFSQVILQGPEVSWNDSCICFRNNYQRLLFFFHRQVSYTRDVCYQGRWTVKKKKIFRFNNTHSGLMLEGRCFYL